MPKSVLPAGIQAIAANEANIARLLRQLRSPKRVIPFVGAGMSAPFGFPSWNAFLRHEAEGSEFERAVSAYLSADKYEEAAEEVLKARGQNYLDHAIQATFGEDRLPERLHGAACLLPRLTVGPVITTNYDRVLEKVFEQQGKKFEDLIWGAHRATSAITGFHEGRGMLLKMHGDAEDPDGRILTRSDYETCYGDLATTEVHFEKPLPRLLHHMLVGCPFLFLGCSLAHDRTMEVIAKVTAGYEGHSFAVLPHPGTDEGQRSRENFLLDRRILPIWYPTGEHTLIEPFLAYLLAQTQPGEQKKYWNVPPEPKSFSGRDREMDALDKAFDTEGAQSRRQIVTGLDGMGKTTLAAKYCYRADCEHVLWTDASTRTNLETGLIALARAMKLTVQEEASDALRLLTIQLWLADDDNDYLLVLDDMTTYEDVTNALPHAARGRLLMTSSVQDLQRLDVEQPLEMPPLARADAAEFLLRRSGRDRENAADRQTAEQIADALGCLPLWLELAAASLYMDQRTALADYRDALRAGDALPDVAVVWKKNLEALKNQPSAVALLNLSAFLGLNAIPFEIVQEYFKGRRQAAETALEHLHRWSLVTRDPGDASYSLNRLLQDSIRDRLSEETCKSYVREVAGLLGKLFPQPNLSQPDSGKDVLCMRLLPHILACADDMDIFQVAPHGSWKLLYNVSVFLNARARYAAAAPILDQAIDQAQSQNASAQDQNTLKRYAAQTSDLAKSAIGVLDLDDAIELNNLGMLYTNQGRYAEAEPLLVKALSICERTLGPEHPDTASSLNNLAALYRSQGRYDEAEPLFKQALAIREKGVGPAHPDTASNLNNLAALYTSQGRFNEAMALYERALAINEKNLGLEHLHTATSLHNMAYLYSRQERYDEAEPLFKQALAISEEILGTEHPVIAHRLNSLAGLYNDQNRYDKAEPLSKRALAIWEKILGPEHPDIAVGLNILASLYHKQQRDSEADPLLVRALAIREKALGSEHPDTASNLNNLAAVYSSQKRFNEAMSLYERALAINEKVLGPEHPITALNLNNLATLYAKQDRYAEAKPMFIRALATLEKVLGSEHPHTLALQSAYAEFRERSGNS